MDDISRTYYQHIDLKEGASHGYANAQTLHKYNGREVIVGIRTREMQNIFVAGILVTTGSFYVCEKIGNDPVNGIALNTEKLTGLLVKIQPTSIVLPGDSKVDLSLKF